MLCGTTAKHAYRLAARSARAHVMNFSKPSTVVGGGEMKRDTSSGVSMANSAGASETSRSRSVTSVPVSTGSEVRQSLVTVAVALAIDVGVMARSRSGWYG